MIEPKIIEFGPYRAVGINYIGKNENGEIPKLWDSETGFLSRVAELTPVEGIFFGICRCVPGMTDGTFEYIAGAPIADDAPVPDGMVEAKIAGGTYAAFEVPSLDDLMKAWAPALSDSLGIFIPLIAANCIVLARAESFASKNSIGRSGIDGLAMGLGFALALMLVGAIREFLSTGALMYAQILPDAFPGITFMAQPAGGFLTLGLVIAAMQAIRKAKGGAS